MIDGTYVQDQVEARAVAFRLAAIYGAIFFIVGIQTAYLPTWLLGRGLDATGIAMVLSLPMLVRVATTPLITFAADRFRRPRQTVVILAWGVLASACVLLQVRGFWPILLTMIVFATFWTAIMPLTEALAMRGVRAYGLDYGRMRLWGSLTFIAAGLLGGWTLGRYGAWPIVPLMIAASAALVLAATVTAISAFPDQQESTNGPATASTGIEWQDVGMLLRTRAFFLLLLVSGLGQATHAVYYAFGTIHWQAIGLPATSIGVLWSIGVIAEIGLFAVSGWVSARVSSAWLLVIGAAAGVLRWPLVALDPPFAMLCLIQVLHGLTFGAVHLGAIHLISQLAGEDRASTAQGLHATFAAGIFMAAAFAASGPLYRAFGGGAYLAMALVAGAAVLLGLALIRELKTTPLAV